MHRYAAPYLQVQKQATPPSDIWLIVEKATFGIRHVQQYGPWAVTRPTNFVYRNVRLKRFFRSEGLFAEFWAPFRPFILVPGLWVIAGKIWIQALKRYGKIS
jgi:hypothetical protein